MIRAQFVLGTSLSSRAIAWFSAGHYSHVDAILPDGSLLGARSDAVGGQRPGVRIRPPFYERWKQRLVLELDTTPLEERQYLDFLLAQIGRPYDSTAIWGFAFSRDWRSAEAWFCSELVTAAIEIAGRCPLLITPRNKVTPSALAMVMSALGGKNR